MIDLSGLSNEELLNLEKVLSKETDIDFLLKLLSENKIPKIDDYTLTSNGTLYNKNKKGFIPDILEEKFNNRVKYKKLMLEEKKKLEVIEEKLKNKNNPKIIEEKRLINNNISKYNNFQQAMKILLNGFYGSQSNIYSRWFNFEMAEAITSSGQLTIRWIDKHINQYFNKLLKTTNVDYVIASDTDSIYLNMEPFVKMVNETDPSKITDILDGFCEQKIQPFLNKTFDNLFNYMNAYEQKMFMKREAISEKGIWKAKKMYILNVWNMEGVKYNEPKIKMNGIEAVRSSTPGICRKSIKKALEILMNKSEEDLQNYIAEFRKEFYTKAYEEVAFPRGMNNLDKYSDRNSIYRSGTPIHVRGALVYNHHLKKLGLENKYRPISDGDKVKFSYLKMPNPMHENVISVPEVLPPELNLEKYIDYETQFEKTFFDPIKSITDLIDWQLEPKNTLESLFG